MSTPHAGTTVSQDRFSAGKKVTLDKNYTPFILCSKIIFQVLSLYHFLQCFVCSTPLENLKSLPSQTDFPEKNSDKYGRLK